MVTAMDVSNVRGLVFNNELVGLRFYTSEDTVFDVGKDALKKVGLRQFSISDRIELNLVDELLKSYDEIHNGLTPVDISEDESALEILKDVLDTPEFKEKLAGFQKPYEVSLVEFMGDEDWVPRKVDRTDEYKRQHLMMQPDGKDYRGGWIGSYRSLHAAKSGFHFDQVRNAMHSGKTVADVAMATYPALKQAKENISMLETRIKVDGETVSIVADGETKTFLVTDFPDMRVYRRGFVRENGLISTDIVTLNDKNVWFDAQEVTVIALERAISSSTITVD